MIAVNRAAGRMQVDQHMRIIFMNQLNQRTRFGRIQLHMVPVEVIPLRIRALTHTADRAMLPGTVIQTDALVAIGIVYGRYEQHQRICPLCIFAGRQLTGKHQQRFFTAYLSGMDIRLDKYPGFTRLYRLFRTGIPYIAIDQ